MNAARICDNEIVSREPASACPICGAQVLQALVDQDESHLVQRYIERDAAGFFQLHQCAPVSAQPTCR